MFRASLLFTFVFSTLSFAQVDGDAKILATMKAGEGLQVELFASEPMLINPTAMDVDHKGRVWITEAVNYRCKLRNKPFNRVEGDRIQILIDEKGDGKATKAVTFYQGKELYGPLSVCVIPQADGKKLRVLVAQSPDILEFTCTDGPEPKADGPPTKFLSGFGGFDHDHGVHGLNIGPDGKLYFTVGDAGVNGLQSKDGKGKKYTSNTTDIQKGTVWRCDLNGNNLELIAHNFRNNYECCVDSFGEIWLSDNDDDGNQQTRICHVMPGGNYGYGPRGAGQTHWHEEQPGIVHKTLRTGFGSPTGITFYEGNLLPKQYHNGLLHTDAGPRELRCFTRKPKGAGYELDKTLMLTSSDTWFRPSDVCVGPDGSVFVADWYDPGVGGHGMGDWTRGRVFRITPTGHKGYKVAEESKVIDKVLSPCQSTRIGGLNQFSSMPVIDREKIVFEETKNAKSERAFILVGLAAIRDDEVLKLLDKRSPEEIAEYSKTQAEFLKSQRVLVSRIRNLHYVRYTGSPHDLGDRLILSSISGMKESGVQLNARAFAEILILLQDVDPKYLSSAILTFAKLYDGQDIFYRAALNIACGTDPERRDKILADFEKHFPEWNDKVADLVWELRPKSMLPKMEKLLTDTKLTVTQRARIVDILAVNDDPNAGKAILTLLSQDHPAEVKARAIENLKLFLPGKWSGLAKANELKTAIDALLKDSKTTTVGLQLIAVANDFTSIRTVDKLAGDDKQPLDLRIQAVRTLGQLKSADAVDALISLSQPQGPITVECIKALGLQIPNGPKAPAYAQKAFDALQQAIVMESASIESKQAALVALAGTRTGTGWLLKLKEDGKMPAAIVADAGRLLRNSAFAGERNKALTLFPAAAKLDITKLPSLKVLASKIGNAENGKAIFKASAKNDVQCAKCHTIRNNGGSIGPDLSMIGLKGSKENLFESLITPSKAIADQYVSWKIDSDDGQSVIGLMVSESADKIVIRDANGKDFTFPTKGIEKKKLTTSIMPEDLVKTLTEEELIDVVEYLFTLKTPMLTPDSWQILGALPGNQLDMKLGKSVLGWRTIRVGQNGYYDLAAFHGDLGKNSTSILSQVIESPEDQEATILLGTDDGCRLFVNGEKVFGHDRSEAAVPEKDSVKVKLKKGSNTIELRVNNGDNPHGFYFNIVSGKELKIGK